MIKLIACDLDGTVLDENKRPDSGLKEAALKLKDKGIGLTFLSGRNEELFSHLIDEFEIVSPYVTNNGGNVYQKHVRLFSDYIPQEYNDVLTGILHSYGIVFRVFADEAYYAYGESAFFASRLRLINKSTLLPFDPSKSLRDLHVYKVTSDFSMHREEIDEVSKEVKRLCPNMNFLKAETDVYCANSLSANKGEGLKKICKYMGIDVKEVMAFGDNETDLMMLKEAGVSVAMGNSSDLIRKQCDYVCKDNNHNGVSAFLNAYFKL